MQQTWRTLNESLLSSSLSAVTVTNIAGDFDASDI